MPNHPKAMKDLLQMLHELGFAAFFAAAIIIALVLMIGYAMWKILSGSNR
jgi:hypothetical protein